MTSSRLQDALAELVVVVIGVIIALAADGWREDLAERRTEAETIERLAADFRQTLEELEETRETVATRTAAAADLDRWLDDESPKSDEELLALTLVATRSGHYRTDFGIDATYRELQASGQLSILRSPELRRRLVQFYALSEEVYESLSDPSFRDVTYRFTRLTGLYPGAAEPSTLTPRGRARLLRDVRENPEFAAELRQLSATYRINLRRLDQLSGGAEQLLAMLEAESG